MPRCKKAKIEDFDSEIMNAVDFFMPDYQVGELTIRGLARAVREKMHEDFNRDFSEKEIIEMLVDLF